MHLERLEISGFKSFSDRSELAFDRGVTAIVGPNGCGKSNVADALTWVLGEQSAKSLRGDKMEDVIFNGSDARKPTGAAEVRLRFGNVIVPPSVLKELGEDVPVAGNPEPGAGAGASAAVEAAGPVEQAPKPNPTAARRAAVRTALRRRGWRPLKGPAVGPAGGGKRAEATELLR